MSVEGFGGEVGQPQKLVAPLEPFLSSGRDFLLDCLRRVNPYSSLEAIDGQIDRVRQGAD